MQEWSALLHPNKIVIKRDERQRRELTEIESLAESILLRGQLQPIVVQRETLELIAGERRLTAIRKLAADYPDRHFHVKVVYSDEVDPDELKALELEENIKRIDLPWKNKCEAVFEYHSRKLKTDPEWNQTKTAKALVLSAPEVTELLAVAAELRKGNPLVTEAPKLSTAKGIVRRQQERRVAAETSALVAMAAPKRAAAPKESTDSEDSTVLDVIASMGTGYILNEDFKIWSADYEGPRFNLIHCDFPYGVGMHESDQGSGASHGTYEDTPEIYWSLLDTFLNNLDNFTEESAHLIFWFSMDYYHDTLQRFEHDRLYREANKLSPGWRVNPFPLIWHKSDGAGILPDPNRGPRRTYETALFASRGDRKIVRAVANSVASPIQRGRHMSEKSQDVLRHFFRMVVDEHSAVLDPTCGSGSAIRAAAATGAGRYLGLEINTEFADHADEVLKQFLEDQETPK